MLRTTLAIALGLVSLNSFAAFEVISHSGATVLRDCLCGRAFHLLNCRRFVCVVPAFPCGGLQHGGVDSGLFNQAAS